MSQRPLPTGAPTAMISVVRRPLAPSARSNIATVTASTAAAQPAKAQIKLEDRLSKAEAKIQDLQREKDTAHNQLGDLQTELRLAAQREAKLKHGIEKWEKAHTSLKEKSSKLSDLQARLAELHKVHEESKARRQSEIDDLTERLRKEQDRRKHELNEARQSTATESAKWQQYQTKCSALQAELDSLKLQGTASHDLVAQKQKQIDELQAERDSDRVILIDSQKYARKIENEFNARIEELQTQLDAKTDEVERRASEQQATAEQERSELHDELEELQLELEQTEHQYAHNLRVIAKAVAQQIDTVKLDSRAETHSWVARWHRAASEQIQLESLSDERAAQIHELVAVVKQVQDDRDAAKRLATSLHADLVSITTELHAERHLADTLIAQQLEDQRQRHSTQQTSSSDADSEGEVDAGDMSSALLRVQLDDVQSHNALLQQEASELQQLVLSRSNDAKQAEEALAAVRAQVSTLETSVAAKTREVDNLVSQLAELEPLRRRLAGALEEAAAAKKEAQAQTEAARSIAASLQNARVAEEAWRDERDRMASLLDHAEHYEALYHELAEQAKHLVERNALAEQEKATLSALNAELLGHNNPNQKIMYMDRIRHELDDARRDSVGLRMHIERLEHENAQLSRELASFRAVDVPLSQRPRTEVTRVLRASADPAQLLRKVSAAAATPAAKVELPRAEQRVSTPVRTNFAPAANATPFSAARPRFSAQPLLPEVQKAVEAAPKHARKPEVEEAPQRVAEPLAHPPLPVHTGLSTKKRRSYGNLSVHAIEADDAAAEEAEHQQMMDDDTLLANAVENEAEVAVKRAAKRNAPRATLVNSGALRRGAPSISAPAPAPAPGAAAAHVDSMAAASGGVVRRPSLATSSLGIKARRVSEIVRASTPPLGSIADFSGIDTPGGAMLLDAALPSPSPYGLADWTATDETSHVPALTAHFGSIAHSTPLPAKAGRRAKSRYSGAQRVALAPETTPRAKPSLLPPQAKNQLLAVYESDAVESPVYEREHDSFRNGWLDDDIPDLPDFTIDQAKPAPAQTANAKGKKVKPRASSKLVKPGPMARTFFR
ncbi:hypothetical protein PaG_04186 [Moesziomyces aphidis]|uniref:Uncharacterized protein n=1 Tax=Moesziomyces aphidis TaxID=84754 RepID=W3VLL4_MOEAP|nr:hypothetical protein PaG_04186 [Moesziomyces aphidis]